MASGTSKVWVIDAPKEAEADKPAPNPGLPAGSTGSAAKAQTSRNRSVMWSAQFSDVRWNPVLTAYVVGPLAIWAWLSGKARIAWASMGLASVAAGLLLVIRWPQFVAWLESGPNSVFLWMAVVPPVVMLVAVVWARAIAASSSHTGKKPQYPGWMRPPGMVALMSMFVPGFGLLFAGHHRRAAWTFGMIGPLAIAIIVLANWRWLWGQTRSATSAGFSGTSVEVFLIMAACVVAFVALIWIVQALDGARRATRQRSLALTDATSGALLVALVAFTFAFRPASVAQTLHTVSLTMAGDGLQLIPLRLCEAANKLDPASPVYLADAVRYNDALGMTEAAAAKRATLEARLAAYVKAVQGDNHMVSAGVPPTNQVVDALDGECLLGRANGYTGSRLFQNR